MRTFLPMSGEPAREWTVLQLIDWTKDYFARADLEDPRLAAEVLLAKALSCGRMDLYTRFDHVVEPEKLKRYRDFVHRASSGEPIAYLVGQREFYSLTLTVTPDVLIPRPETELLVDAALEFVKTGDNSGRLWDVCTGCGCVAVAAAKYAENLDVLATDASPAALAVATGNAERHGVADRVRFVKADLLAASAADDAVDVITANPPYVRDDEMAGLPADVLCEPELALRAGPTGLEHITRIVSDAPDRLRTGGRLAMEIGHSQAEAVYDLLNGDGRYEDIRLVKDLAGIERAAVAQVR